MILGPKWVLAVAVLLGCAGTPTSSSVRGAYTGKLGNQIVLLQLEDSNRVQINGSTPGIYTVSNDTLYIGNTSGPGTYSFRIRGDSLVGIEVRAMILHRQK